MCVTLVNTGLISTRKGRSSIRHHDEWARPITGAVRVQLVQFCSTCDHRHGDLSIYPRAWLTQNANISVIGINKALRMFISLRPHGNPQVPLPAGVAGHANMLTATGLSRVVVSRFHNYEHACPRHELLDH